jgi:hypothetical protein
MGLREYARTISHRARRQAAVNSPSISSGIVNRIGPFHNGPYEKPIHGDWDNEPQLSDDVATPELRGQILIVTLNSPAALSK